MPKTYHQFCGVARALDVIGDRWTLLIVRQLLAGPARYGDLATGLPGVASNLLADRLKALEQQGVVERAVDPERSGTRYQLTAWGAELREPIEGLVRWSIPLMASGPRPDDVFRPEWLVIALRALLHGRRATPRRELGLRIPGATLVVTIGRSGATVVEAPDADALPPSVLHSEGALVLGLASGVLTVDDVVELSRFEGDVEDLRGLAPVVAPGR